VNGNFLAQETMPTTRDPRLTAEALAAKIGHLTKVFSDRVFEGIGISIPGRFNESSQRIVFAPNLGWPEFDFKGTIERATGMHVELENAANACVLAEVWFGHREKVRDFVVVTVSEGIGTGVFANGQLIRGLNDMAGEFGHVPLDPNGLPCTCGRRGCWEVYASNRAALRYYQESAEASDSLTFQELLALAESGNPLALKALDRMVHALGRGMRMLVAGFAPEEVVVVGELTRQWQRFGPAIEAELAMGLPGSHPPRVRPAEGNMARLRGTVALVLQKHFGPSAGMQEEQGKESLRRQSLAG
jgi:predicted NBD/HSP70 family sugar kinase